MKDLVIVGLGQLGQLFGRGALRAGMRVTPVLRDAPPVVWRGIEPGVPVLLAVGESALEGALASVPARLREDVVLVQNELFASTWRSLGLESPTVVVFWSNQKAGRALEPGRRTGMFGRHAAAMAAIGAALGVEGEVLSSAAALDAELAAKFAFVLAINALGLVEAWTVGEWLARDPARVDAVVEEALRLGAARVGHALELEAARAAVRDAMVRLSSMPARGRSSAARLERALAQAGALGLELEQLAAIAAG